MIRTKEDFKAEFNQLSRSMFDSEPEKLDNEDKFEVLAELIKQEASSRAEAAAAFEPPKNKRVYYFSMEFLIGKLMENYLINLGFRDRKSVV